MNLLRRVSAIFRRGTESEETLQEQPQDNSKLKSIQGIVTHLCSDYGWINESIFFNTEVVSDNVPVNIGGSVIALVEEDETSHVLRAIKVCVTSVDGRTGVVEASIFFNLDSLHTLPGYTPSLYDIVNVVVVDSIQSHYSRRVVSMIPVDTLY
ncbi:Putative helicase Mov10l1 [Cricetulus griseus]|uniref:Putative helicase Mov10l1 n=1 Tax=Cricetulus griseus TaxID=10029 RepID=G3H6L6_CRIGR|nr:Putative helicase Mov10l1 [Cricetulus griseus]